MPPNETTTTPAFYWMVDRTGTGGPRELAYRPDLPPGTKWWGVVLPPPDGDKKTCFVKTLVDLGPDPRWNGVPYENAKALAKKYGYTEEEMDAALAG